MKNNRLLVFLIVAFMMGACSFVTLSPNSVVGSGNVVSETRSVSGFNDIVLKSSANVETAFGTTESVSVEADDNVVPLIDTSVQNGQLVISTRSNTTFSINDPVHVRITMKSLNAITLSGSGNINVSQMAGDRLGISLPGSGNITVTGTATIVQISLPGSGNIFCNGLKAKSAEVNLTGSGNIEVFANQRLDANLRGTGTIRYSGNPAQVNKSITGSGSITP